jgi:hypothetical protein
MSDLVKVSSSSIWSRCGRHVCLDAILFISTLLVCTIIFITIFVIMLCHLLIWIKSSGNFLIYSLIQKHDYRQVDSSCVVAARRTSPFEGSHYKIRCAREIL